MTYQYDTASRLLALDNFTASGQHLYEYTYDDVGNRLKMTVTDASGPSEHVYSYDNIYQITEADYPSALDYLATDTEFSYDAAGNRTSVIDGSGPCNYTTNALNQYTAAGGKGKGVRLWGKGKGSGFGYRCSHCPPGMKGDNGDSLQLWLCASPPWIIPGTP